ncbi:MAG: DMT family transporter [Gracilibacteraceae bacterium]|jgi:drug/metabolite transporter (DMT)-like permease|nr:DMT family transporter [Gracilibacteraceae bacterium]
MTKFENNILLLSITVCWASAYIFVKRLPDELSAFAYLTLTTGIAAALLSILFFKQLRHVKKSTILSSLVLSLLLTAILLFEREGLKSLPASNASFIASLTIVTVPLLMFLLKSGLTLNNAVGAVVIVLGLCLTSGFALSAFFSEGTVFMLLVCLATAVYTIAVDRFTKKEDPLLLSVIQMIFTAFSGFVLWFAEEPTTFASVNYTNELLSSIFILAFFAKAYAYVALMFGQKYTDSMSVAIIASTEPVITLLLAVFIPAAFGTGERFNAVSLSGAIVIAMGSVIAGSNFMTRKKSRREAA